MALERGVRCCHEASGVCARRVMDVRACHSGTGRTHSRVPGSSEHDTRPQPRTGQRTLRHPRPRPQQLRLGLGVAGVLPCPGLRVWCWQYVFTLLVSGDSAQSVRGVHPESRALAHALRAGAPRAAGGQTRPPSVSRFSFLRFSGDSSVEGPEGHSLSPSE